MRCSRPWGDPAIPSLVIEANELSRDFGAVRALQNVSFTVSAGQVFGYLGPNGCGKTTTVRILTTLIAPTSGDVRVFGYDPKSEPLEIRKRVGLVQQEHSYEPYLSVLENLSLYGYLQGLSKVDAKSRARDLLETFDLWESRSRKAVALSGGQLRRMQIARELVTSPELLFLDEPTLGLDIEAKITALSIFKKMAQESTTVFFTTHNLSEVDELCDTVAFLRRGRLLAIESVEAFRQRASGRKLEDAYLDVVAETPHVR